MCSVFGEEMTWYLLERLRLEAEQRAATPLVPMAPSGDDGAARAEAGRAAAGGGARWWNRLRRARHRDDHAVPLG